jgi:hypothetical protein
MKIWQVVLIMLLLVSIAPDAVGQCAMCRSTVESTVSNGRSIVASQLNLGILYLLTIPYLLVAGVAYLWYRNSRLEHGRRIEILSRVRQAMGR